MQNIYFSLIQGSLFSISCFFAPIAFANSVPDNSTSIPVSKDPLILVSENSSSTYCSNLNLLQEKDANANSSTNLTQEAEATLLLDNLCNANLKDNPATETQSFANAQENNPQNPPQEGDTNLSSEEFTAQEGGNPWRFSITPYATIPVSLYGTNVIQGNSVNYSAGLGTLLQLLQIVVSARAEAWNGNWGLIADGYYASLVGNGFQQFDRPIANATLASTLTFQQGIYDFASSYHLGAIPVAFDPKKPSNKDFPLIWFQPILGTRLNQIDSTIKSTLTVDRNDRVFDDRKERVFERSFSLGRTWFEPLVGAKIGLQVSDPLTLWLRGDASGFGLAGETDMSWNIFFGAEYWLNRSLSLSLSYRFYEIKYGNGTGDDAFRFNESFNGPTIAATFRF